MKIGSIATITWDKSGPNELVLLTPAGFTDGTIEFPWEQDVQSNPRTRMTDLEGFARGNINSGFSFTTIDEHGLAQVAAHEFMFDRMLALNARVFLRATLTVEISGGKTYALSNAIIQRAPCRLVERAMPVRTTTSWQIFGGTWSEVI